MTEITRRELISNIIRLSAVFVLPISSHAQERIITPESQAAVAERMRNRFGRIVVQPRNIELDDYAKTIGISELGIVESYKQEASNVGDIFSAWDPNISLDDISLKTGFKGDSEIEYISVNNAAVFTKMEEIVDRYETTFVPLVTGLSYGKVISGQYPSNLYVGTNLYQLDDETKDIWSYLGEKDHTNEQPRLEVKGAEFSFFQDDILRMAVEIPIQSMTEMFDSLSGVSDHLHGETGVDHLMVLVSGGPDSATTIAEARRVRPDARITPLYLQFGHEQDRGELSAIGQLVKQFGLETPEVVDMQGIREVLSGRVLIHSGAAIMPFGNALVLTFALAYAARARIKEIWVGMHADDVRESHEYSREYFDRIQRLADVTSPSFAPRIVTPFIDLDKVSLFRHGATLGVDYGSTWSCIRGTNRHCGKCGACLARQRAFTLAGIKDTTEYEETLPLTAIAS